MQGDFGLSLPIHSGTKYLMLINTNFFARKPFAHVATSIVRLATNLKVHGPIPDGPQP